VVIFDIISKIMLLDNIEMEGFLFYKLGYSRNRRMKIIFSRIKNIKICIINFKIIKIYIKTVIHMYLIFFQTLCLLSFLLK